MARFTLRQLEYFVAVGETGSIARASERINVSSPSISAAITQLEQAFGLPLFVRQHAQGLALTAGGRRMLEQAQNVLDGAQAMHDIAADITGSVRGPLSVGCLVSFAQLVLPKLRRSYEDQFPEVRFRVYGHTDAVGSSAYNKRLGLRRANAVVSYLSTQGIDRSRLEAVVSLAKPNRSS